MGCHNESCKYLVLMATKHFTSYPIRNKPLISSSRYGTGTRQKNKVTINTKSKQAAVLRGNLHICHLWKRQTDTMMYFRVMDTDEKPTSPSHSTIFWKLNRRKRRRNTSSLVSNKGSISPPFSIDGLFFREAQMLPKKLSSV